MSDLHQTLDAQALRTVTLIAENKHLRRVARDSRNGRILRQTLADAKTLLTWRFAGMAITRRNAHSMGMSERRWMAARGLLMLARIHDGNDVVEREFEVCIRAVETAGRHIERDGLERLKLRMARNGR